MSNIRIIILVILFTSCNHQENKISIDDWNDSSRDSFKSEVQKLNNQINEKVALNRIYGLLKSRESLIEPLDSIINLNKVNEVDVIENYILNTTISYSAKFKVNKKTYLFKSIGDNTSLIELDHGTESFHNDIDNICNKKAYNDTFQVRRISIYNNLNLANKISEAIKVCANLNPDGSDL